MAEKDKIFSSSAKYRGIYNWSDFYKFCYDWLAQEMNLDMMENKYVEKVSGDSKNVDVEWVGVRKVTDYFKFEVKVKYRIIGMKKVELKKDGATIKTNEGEVEMQVAGTLIRDYQGKFETTPFRKFLRSVYEKYIITARVDQMEAKLIGDCDEFLSQAKAWLDLEGRR